MIVAGFGFRRTATIDSLRDALAQTGGQPQALAAPSDKAGADCLIQLAQSLFLPILAIEPCGLQAVETITQSPMVRAKRGTGSVAEAAALAGAGPNAQLIGVRCVSADRLATAALAKGME